VVEQFVLDHPIAVMLLTIAFTLFGKYFWDRYLSQTSRISRREFEQACLSMRSECELKRGGCLAERLANKAHFEGLIKQQAGCLEDAFEDAENVAMRRLQTRKALMCIMMTQLKICEALNASGVLGVHVKMDCDDISKLLVEMGGLE